MRVLIAQFGAGPASSLYGSPAWPNPADPPFVNAALGLLSAPPPATLLAALHGIEAAFGRRRALKNAPRTLDLDLLAYGGLRSDGPLLLPHPGLESRDFVLAPLAEIAPDFRSPASGRTIAGLLAALSPVSAIRLAR